MPLLAVHFAICWALLLLFIFALETSQGFGTLNPAVAFSRPSFVKECYSPSSRKFAVGTPLYLHQVSIANIDNVLSEELHTRLEDLVSKRARARWEGKYEEADLIRSQIDEIPIPAGFEILIQDFPRKEGGGSSWKLLYEVQVPPMEGETVLQLAHSALGLAVSSSERNAPIPKQQLQSIVERAKDRLECWSAVHEELSSEMAFASDKNFSVPISLIRSLTDKAKGKLSGWVAIESELRGRKAADAAFWFALVGSTDQALFSLLADVCTKELQRFGQRPSCRTKDVWKIIERLAAAGILKHDQLEKVATNCLVGKGCEEIKSIGSNKLLNLHSDRCLLMIWKFSTRQRKQQSFLRTAKKHWESQKFFQPPSVKYSANSSTSQGVYFWQTLFADATRPLVIDIGCGMGVSLLGLSSLSEEDFDDPSNLVGNLSACNFLGVDLSGLAIRYAQGVASRWGVDDRLQFVVDSAEGCLRALDSYPGPITLCLIQFPTPYRLQTSASEDLRDASDGSRSNLGNTGNTQLPSSPSDGFMVTVDLLQLVNKLISRPSDKAGGMLLLQSNCEDVAIWMRELSCKAGFRAVPVTQEVVLDSEIDESVMENMPKRTLDWIQMGGSRAEGEGWSGISMLPRKGVTETEIACNVNKIPIHRCLLIPAK